MTDFPVMDMTASFAPAYLGMLAILIASGLGILACAWKPSWRGVSFSSGFELPSWSLLHWSR